MVHKHSSKKRNTNQTKKTKTAKGQHAKNKTSALLNSKKRFKQRLAKPGNAIATALSKAINSKGSSQGGLLQGDIQNKKRKATENMKEQKVSASVRDVQMGIVRSDKANVVFAEPIFKPDTKRYKSDLSNSLLGSLEGANSAVARNNLEERPVASTLRSNPYTFLQAVDSDDSEDEQQTRKQKMEKATTFIAAPTFQAFGSLLPVQASAPEFVSPSFNPIKGTAAVVGGGHVSPTSGEEAVPTGERPSSVPEDLWKDI